MKRELLEVDAAVVTAALTPAELAVEPYIDKREVARRMGRTTRTVDSLMRRGLLPYYKFDWRVAFRWSEVQAHLADKCRVCQRVGGGA